MAGVDGFGGSFRGGFSLGPGLMKQPGLKEAIAKDKIKKLHDHEKKTAEHAEQVIMQKNVAEHAEQVQEQEETPRYGRFTDGISGLSFGKHEVGGSRIPDHTPCGSEADEDSSAASTVGGDAE